LHTLKALLALVASKPAIGIPPCQVPPITVESYCENILSTAPRSRFTWSASRLGTDWSHPNWDGFKCRNVQWSCQRSISILVRVTRQRCLG